MLTSFFPIHALQINKSLKAENWAPIRITMDYRFINGTKEDPYGCKTFYGNTTSFWELNEICESKYKNYMSELNPSVIGTLENAKNYISRLVQVHPRDTPVYSVNKMLKPTPNRDNLHFQAAPYTYDETFDNTDLYIAVVYRPLTSKTIGQTVPYITSIDEKLFTYRPLTGLIVVSMDPSKHKKVIQDENSPDPFFFWDCVKSFITILGFDRDNFNNFHQQNNGKYSQIICTQSDYYQT